MHIALWLLHGSYQFNLQVVYFIVQACNVKVNNL